MQHPIFRVIHKPNITDREVCAALQALDRLGHGVKTDAMPIDAGAIKNVRMGWHFMEALGSGGPARIDSSGFLMLKPGMPISELGRNMIGIIGIGLTDAPLSLSDGIEDGEQDALGASRYRYGALVSLAAVRDTFGFERGEYRKEPETAMRAVELAVRNQVGHVLIEGYERREGTLLEERDCPHRSCLLQQNFGPVDFIERVVRSGLDFCFDCKKRMMLELDHLRGF